MRHTNSFFLILISKEVQKKSGLVAAIGEEVKQ